MIQKTIKNAVVFNGLGVHSGKYSSVKINPADEDFGIIFIHKGFPLEAIKIGAVIPLAAMHATVLPQKSWTLSTVEHLIAALRVAGVDNALIEVDSEEIPILDGSASPFFYEISKVGLIEQSLPRKFLTPLSVIEFEGQGKKIRLEPFTDSIPYGAIRCTYSADFKHFMLGNKSLDIVIDQTVFKNEIAPARTFGFVEQLPFLRKHKLALASSLGNTLVYDVDNSINDVRLDLEWVRHKLLDFIGDLGLLPHPFTGSVHAAQTGHAFNRHIIEHYLINPQLWQVI